MIIGSRPDLKWTSIGTRQVEVWVDWFLIQLNNHSERDWLSWRSIDWLTVSIECLKGDRWISIRPWMDLDQTSTGWGVGRPVPHSVKQPFWKREKVFCTPRPVELAVDRVLFTPLTGWTKGRPAPRLVELGVDWLLIQFNRLSRSLLNNQLFQLQTF